MKSHATGPSDARARGSAHEIQFAICETRIKGSQRGNVGSCLVEATRVSAVAGNEAHTRARAQTRTRKHTCWLCGTVSRGWVVSRSGGGTLRVWDVAM